MQQLSLSDMNGIHILRKTSSILAISDHPLSLLEELVHLPSGWRYKAPLGRDQLVDISLCSKCNKHA